METIRDAEVFRRAARRALEAGKAVVVLKAGRSELAAHTAAAHTGAFVGDDATVDAVLRDLGEQHRSNKHECSLLDFYFLNNSRSVIIKTHPL